MNAWSRLKTGLRSFKDMPTSMHVSIVITLIILVGAIAILIIQPDAGPYMVCKDIPGGMECRLN